MDYLFRVDDKLYKKARIKAIKEDLRMPAILTQLLELWVKGKIDLKGKAVKTPKEKGVTK